MKEQTELNPDKMNFLKSYVDSKTIFKDKDPKRIEEIKKNTLSNIDDYKKLGFLNKRRFNRRMEFFTSSKYPLIFNKWTAALAFAGGIGLTLAIVFSKPNDDSESQSPSPSSIEDKDQCEAGKLIEDPYNETESTKYPDCLTQNYKENECKRELKKLKGELTEELIEKLQIEFSDYSCKNKKETDEKCKDEINENENFKKCTYCPDLYPTNMLTNVDRYNELKSKYPNKNIFGYYGNCQCSDNELIEKSESEIRYKDCDDILKEKDCQETEYEVDGGLNYISCKHFDNPITHEGEQNKVYNEQTKTELDEEDEELQDLLDLKDVDILNLTEEQLNDLCKYYELEDDIEVANGLKDLWNYYHVDLAEYPELQKDFKDSDDMTRRYKMLNSFGLTIDDDGEVVENQEGYEYRMSLEDQFNFNQDNEDEDDDDEDNGINNEITENPKNQI